MRADVIGLDGTEGTEADFQRDVGDVHAHLRDLFQQPWRKMQPGRRRGGRTGIFGVDGLIILGTRGAFMDIRRQRHGAVGLRQSAYVAIGWKSNGTHAVVAFYLADHGDGPVRKTDAAALRQTPAGTHERLPPFFRLVLGTQEQDLALRNAAFLNALNTRCHDARVVAHEYVARTQPFGEIAKAPVKQRAVAATQRQQSAAVARFSGNLSDQFGRQSVIIRVDVVKIRLIRHTRHSCFTVSE